VETNKEAFLNKILWSSIYFTSLLFINEQPTCVALIFWILSSYCTSYVLICPYIWSHSLFARAQFILLHFSPHNSDRHPSVRLCSTLLRYFC
jgi:hypothetical protein